MAVKTFDLDRHVDELPNSSEAYGSDMPRIVLVVSSFPQLSETFIVSKFCGLLELGWDVHVVCSSIEKDQWDNFPELKDRSVRRRVHQSATTKSRLRAAVAAPFVFTQAAVRAPLDTAEYLFRGAGAERRSGLSSLYLDARLLTLAPDLIHFEFGAAAVERMHLKDHLGCSIVVSFRGYDINYVGLEDDGYYLPVWRGADALHFLGRDLWNRARRRGCPSDKPHALIPPAIDPVYFRPDHRRRQDATTPLRILSVGRLAWIKGYEYALQAVRMLINKGVLCEYTIVGDGPFREAVYFARHQLRLEDHVTLCGGRALAEVREKMKCADVFLHAAVSEGFCNALLEAQAMRLPVVCSDAGGLRENVVDGETGFVVRRRDPRALADKLLELSSNPELRDRMGQAGRERVQKHFQLGDQLRAFDVLYRSLLFGSSESERAGARSATACSTTNKLAREGVPPASGQRSA